MKEMTEMDVGQQSEGEIYSKEVSVEHRGLMFKTAIEQEPLQVPLKIELAYERPQIKALSSFLKVQEENAEGDQRYAGGEPPYIVWREAGEGRYTDSNEGCLDAFLKLANADDEAVLEFVKEWGVLGIRPDVLDRRIQKGEYEAELCEPVEMYRAYARQAYAFIMISVALKDGKEPDLLYWKAALCRPLGGELPENWEAWLPFKLDRSVKVRGKEFLMKNTLVSLFNTWLAHLNLFPVLSWTNEGPPLVSFSTSYLTQIWDERDEKDRSNVEWWDKEGLMSQEEEIRRTESHWIQRPSRLFSLLALEVAGAVTYSEKTYICVICGNVYVRKKKHSDDERRLCPNQQCKDEAHREDMRLSYHRRKLVAHGIKEVERAKT